MSATDQTEDWEELDLEDSDDAITVDVDTIEEVDQDASLDGAYDCFSH